jgi:hypothetical protein
MPTEVFINWATAKLISSGIPTCSQRRPDVRVTTCAAVEVVSMLSHSLVDGRCSQRDQWWECEKNDHRMTIGQTILPTKSVVKQLL